jgi:hypothetical protein
MTVSPGGKELAWGPVVHEPVSSLRFGRVLFVEVSPPIVGRRGRYEDVLGPDSTPPERSRFSAPEAATRAILTELERGAAADAVVFGGAGDPLRHRGLGSILRALRARAHVTTVVLTDGRLLADRDVRREVSEAALLVVWLPSVEDPEAALPAVDRRAAWERHVERIASFGREHPTPVALELPVRPGETDGTSSIEGWRRAIDRVRPERILVVAAPGGRAEDPALAGALERVRAALPRRAGAFLDDGTVVDRRSWDPAESAAD